MDGRSGRQAARVLGGTSLAVLILELGAALVWLVTARSCFSYEAMADRRAAIVGAEEVLPGRARPAPDWMGDEPIHPYVGFLPPYVNEVEGSQPWPLGEPLYEPRPEGSLRVVVLGGSVAGNITRYIHEALLAEGADPERTFVVGGSGGGFKQPQQLAVATYLLSTGARVDVFVNVDGFNEAVLPVYDNHRAGVDPTYPRMWHARVNEVQSPDFVRAVAGVVRWREERDRAARWMSESPLRFSVVANVAWSSFDDYARAQLSQRRAEVAAIELDRSYQSHGPGVRGDEDHSRREAAAVWARSSVLLHQLAEANGARYLHFLQPNQYLEGTKPFSEEERERFIHPDGDYGALAAAGYAALFAEVPTLEAAGVRFVDLTRLFAADERTLYDDDCCHFNDAGRRVIAATIAARVAETVALPRAPR